MIKENTSGMTGLSLFKVYSIHKGLWCYTTKWGKIQIKYKNIMCVPCHLTVSRRSLWFISFWSQFDTVWSFLCPKETWHLTHNHISQAYRQSLCGTHGHTQNAFSTFNRGYVFVWGRCKQRAQLRLHSVDSDSVIQAFRLSLPLAKAQLRYHFQHFFAPTGAGKMLLFMAASASVLSTSCLKAFVHNWLQCFL